MYAFLLLLHLPLNKVWYKQFKNSASFQLRIKTNWHQRFIQSRRAKMCYKLIDKKA